jgi:hypothetical protein
MNKDLIHSDTLIWGTPAHPVYYPKVRQSDTMDFNPNNEWVAFEPCGVTPAEPLQSYLSEQGKTEQYPLNEHFQHCQASCCLIASVFFLVRVFRIFV